MNDLLKTRFIKLNAPEHKSKLSQAVKSKVLVRLHNPDKQEISLSPTNVTLGQSGYWGEFDITQIKHDWAQWNGVVFYTFELGTLVFCGKGAIIDTVGKVLRFDFKEVYKCEKRQQDRLFTYPHREIYLHVLLKQKQIQNNISYLNQISEKEKELFNKFNNFLAADQSAPPMRPLRILDLNAQSASFVISVEELESWPRDIKDLSGHLQFADVIFKLNNISVINEVMFKDENAFRVAITFNFNNDLADKLRPIMANDYTSDEILDAFEKLC